MDEKPKRIQSGAFEGAAYYDSGTGYPVMLVHGFPADHTLWKNQKAALQQNYRLLLPDLPGTGASPLIDPISIADMAVFLHAIIDQEKIKKCILIGHSMGGYATLAFAEKFPEKLSGWGLFHSSAYGDTEEKKKGRQRSIRMMKEYGQEQFLRQMLPSLFAETYKKNNRNKIQEIITERIHAGIDALIPYYHAMAERPDRTSALKNTGVPVLFVIGKEDGAAPMDRVLQQVALPPVSEVHLLADCGHMGMLEMPGTATQILEQFIHYCLRNTVE